MNYSKIGMVIADECEFEPMRKFALANGGEKLTIGGMECVRVIRGRITLTAVRCGVGKVNAAAAAAFMIADGAELLMSTGYSGGISRVQKGDTAIATEFAEHDFDLTPLGYELAVKPDQVYTYSADEDVNSIIEQMFPGVVKGPMVTGDCFVCDNKKREWIKNKFDAVACDMETAAVASVGYKCGVKTVALRRISDDAGDDAKDMYRSAAAKYETSMIDMLMTVVDKMAGVD